MVTVDENGYYYIIGRKKNLIILDNGENVSPEELEGLLKKIHLIQDARVCEKEKKICAEVFCPNSSQVDVREEIYAMNRQLPRHKQIAIIEFLDRMPERNSLGKEKRT